MNKKILIISVILVILIFAILLGIMLLRINQKNSGTAGVLTNSTDNSPGQLPNGNNCRDKAEEMDLMKIDIIGGIEASLTKVVGPAWNCVWHGGVLESPKNNIAGGGKICNSGGASDEWSEMPSIGETRFRYRTINGKVISAGTDAFDIFVCNFPDENCTEVNENKLENFICENFINKGVAYPITGKEYNKPQYFNENGERTKEGQDLFIEDSIRLTAKSDGENILRIANSIAGKCKTQGGIIKSPTDVKNGGGFICSIHGIDDKWEALPQNDKLNYHLQYRTVNQDTLTIGTEAQDLVGCGVDTQNCFLF